MVCHQQQEVLVDFIFGLQSGNTVGLVIFRIFHEGHGHSEGAAIEPVPDQVGAIAHDNDELFDSSLTSPPNHVFENGLAAKVNEWLGQPCRHRPDTRPVTGGANKTLLYFFHSPHFFGNNICSCLEPENKLPSERARRSVEEVTETLAVQVVLHVSWIEVIEQVEHTEPDLYAALLATEGHSEFPEHLKIERIELSKVLLVARTDKFTQLVDGGVGKPGVDIED